MPYIGNTAANRFVASKAASVFSGNGSNTTFTLAHGVGSDEDILVSVDGVIQEPSVAYSVSGTTLTFTAPPSNNSGNNIFVYYLFRTVGTVSHPSSNALEATSGTFSDAVTINDGDAGSVTANTVADELVVESSGAGGMSILTPDASDSNLFLGGPGAYAGAIVRWNDDSNLMSIGTNNTGGTMALKIGGFTDALTIDANGHVTKPLQSAFHAKAPGTQSNLSINTGHDVTFNSERFDQNADYDGTNQFTAPVTGKYQLNVNLYLQNNDKDASYIQVGVLTSNKSYYLALATVGFDADPTYFPFTTSVLADMDANDTVKVEIYQSNGSAVLDIDGHSNFSGYLVC